MSDTEYTDEALFRLAWNFMDEGLTRMRWPTMEDEFIYREQARDMIFVRAMAAANAEWPARAAHEGQGRGE